MYHFCYFLLKKEIIFEVATFGGSLNSGGHYFRELQTPVKFYRYFRRVATFGGVNTFGTLRYSCCNIVHLQVSNKRQGLFHFNGNVYY